MLRATHIGGPMAGSENDISLAAPRTPTRLWYAPQPKGYAGPLSAAGYMLVGYEFAPEAPWNEQVEYALDRTASDLRPHPEYAEMEIGTAVYRLVN